MNAAQSVTSATDLGVEKQVTRGYTPALYVDMAALLDMGDLMPLAPTVSLRSDGVGMIYAGQVNQVFGEPESGKTWLAHCAVVEALTKGGSALILDLDHNGPQATAQRLLSLGAPESALRDPDRFRYTEPDDDQQVLNIVADAALWKPDVTVVDSMGELLPLFGASSNSPDDFTRVHTIVLKPLAKCGSAVIVIDHLAKNTDSKVYGSSGTAAKKRAIGGTSLRMTVVEPFTPGIGGKAHVTVNKDRHGGLRAKSPTGDKEPLAGTFHLTDTDGDMTWTIYPPRDGDRADINPIKITPDELAQINALTPPPSTVRDLRIRMSWSMAKAAAGMKEWRDSAVTRYSTPSPETSVTTGKCPQCGLDSHEVNAPSFVHPDCEAN